MRCAVCQTEIRYPDDFEVAQMAGKLDPFARPGDLCDDCAEAERARAQAQAERAADERLDRKLRERP